MRTLATVLPATASVPTTRLVTVTVNWSNGWHAIFTPSSRPARRGLSPSPPLPLLLLVLDAMRCTPPRSTRRALPPSVLPALSAEGGPEVRPV